MAKYAILGQKQAPKGIYYQVLFVDSLNHQEQQNIFVENGQIIGDILKNAAIENEKNWIIRKTQEILITSIDIASLIFTEV